MGGLVTSHGAGLAVPDWPNTYGYNMFLFPPNQWVGGILYEHTHRLMGTVVGFLSIVLVISAYGPSRSEKHKRRLARLTAGSTALAVTSCCALFAAHATGLITFSWKSPFLHLVIGLFSVALIGFIAWRARTPEPRRWVRRLTLLVLAAVILQGVLGGLRVVRLNLDLAIVHGCFAQ